MPFIRHDEVKIQRTVAETYLAYNSFLPDDFANPLETKSPLHSSRVNRDSGIRSIS